LLTGDNDASSPGLGPLQVAEDESGRLYFWARPENGRRGTDGFWLFDDGTWTHHTAQNGLPGDELRAVCPIGGNEVLINTEDGRLVRFRVTFDAASEVGRWVERLADPKWAAREEATAGLAALGRQAELELKRHLGATKDPEVRSRIKMVLDAVKASAERPQRLPGSAYVADAVLIEPEPWRRRPAEPRWLAFAERVTDTRTGEGLGRAGFLLSADGVRRIEGWPAPTDRPRGAWRLSDGADGLWIGVEGAGLFRWDGRKTSPLSDESTRHYVGILGRDAHGRILLTDGTGVVAHWPGRPDRRRALAAQSWRIGGLGAWAVTSDGRAWAELPDMADSLAYWQDGSWHGVAEAGGIEPSVLLPGRDGALFAVMAGPGGGFRVFDGERWLVVHSPADLVRRHPEWVRGRVDSTRWSRHWPLAVDALGRLWMIDGDALVVRTRGEEETVATYAGPPGPRSFRMFDAGRRIAADFAQGRPVHVSCGEREIRIEQLRDARCEFPPFGAGLVDKAGRFWHAGAAGHPCVHAAKGLVAAPAGGVPALCESNGAVWLCEPGVGYNVVDAGLKGSVRVPLASVSDQTPLCERVPGEVWVACPDGLRRFVRRGQGLALDGVFRRGFPLAGARGLRVDGSGALWLLTTDEEGYQLTRLEPPGANTPSER